MVTETRHRNTLENVLDKIEYLIGTYYTDMRGFASMPPSAVFSFLAREVRYMPDPDGYELIMRPNILLGRMAGDCDDKAIAACSYFRCANVTTGYALVSEDRDKPYHHIFCIFYLRGEQYDFDCTYPHNRFLDSRSWARRTDRIIFRGAYD